MQPLGSPQEKQTFAPFSRGKTHHLQWGYSGHHQLFCRQNMLGFLSLHQGQDLVGEAMARSHPLTSGSSPPHVWSLPLPATSQPQMGLLMAGTAGVQVSHPLTLGPGTRERWWHFCQQNRSTASDNGLLDQALDLWHAKDSTYY